MLTKLVKSSPMPLDLTDVRAKLARSAEHSQTIQNEAKTWFDRKPYGLTKKTNADSTRFSLILWVNEPPPFRRWTLVFADFLNNLRSVLDHLVYAVAAHEAAPNPPAYENRLAFPITDSPANFQVAIDQRRLGDISEPMRAVFESFQPYRRPHKDVPPLLAILRDLNNRDKHRLVSLAYGSLARGDFGLTGEFPPGANIRPAPHHIGELKDGTEVFAMISDVPAPSVQFDRTIIDLVITVWHGKRDPSLPPGSEASDIVSVMNLLSGEVRKVIYGVADKVK